MVRTPYSTFALIRFRVGVSPPRAQKSGEYYSVLEWVHYCLIGGWEATRWRECDVRRLRSDPLAPERRVAGGWEGPGQVVVHLGNVGLVAGRPQRVPAGWHGRVAEGGGKM